MTVRQRLAAAEYQSLDELERDVNVAATELLRDIEVKQSTPESRVSSSDSRLWAGVKAFQKIVYGMVNNESQRAKLIKSGHESFVGDLNRVKQENEDLDGSNMFQEGKKVLSIFANPNGARQLFSSIQRPYPLDARLGSGRDTPGTIANVTGPLAEASLPNVISTTTIPQIQVDDPKSKKGRPTFGEVFAPPPSLPQLQPPRPFKHLTTKGSTISFISNDPLSRRSRRDSRDAYNWVSQPLTVGQWLGWGGIDPPQEPTSPEAKRRQRDRALSTGEAKPLLSLSELRDAQKAKDDALFRRVYSTFAPSRDDSGAIVPEAIRNQMWWSRVGKERAIDATLLIDPALLDDRSAVETITSEQEEKEFEQAVQEFEPEDSNYQPNGDDEPTAKDIDDLLSDITDMIETVYSYQLIRNASLASTSRTPVGQNSSLTELTGSPDTPSTAEVEHFKTLRATLALLVSQLPPYAVARLDGDKLKQLNVKTTIVVETSTESGVMEEDQITRLAKQNAPTSAVGHAAMGRGASGTFANYPAAASTFNRSTPLQPGSVPRNSTSYYPNQQPPNRPSIPYSRSTGGLQQLAAYANSTPRTGYTQQQYNTSSQRPSPVQQGASNHYLQQLQSLAGRSSHNQQYGYAQSQNRGFGQQTPVPNYQRTQATPSYGNQYPQSPYQRTASPLNTSTIQAPQYGMQARQGYSTPASSSQSRSQYMPPTQTPNGQQQAAIERQRAELAAQTSARLAAATASGAISPGSHPPTSGTPQQVNGT